MRSLIGKHVPVPTTVLRNGSRDKQWLTPAARADYAKQTAYRTSCAAHNADHWGRFLVARAGVTGGSRIMNAPEIL